MQKTYWNSDEKSPVATAIVSYMSHFFSCGSCRKNFFKKVEEVGDLPSSPDESLLWLWTIHNMANKALTGKATEDPRIPKVQWPNEENCPTCRENGQRKVFFRFLTPGFIFHSTTDRSTREPGSTSRRC